MSILCPQLGGLIKPNQDAPWGTRSGTTSSFSCLSLFRNAAMGAAEDRHAISGLTPLPLSLDDKLLASCLLTATWANLWVFVLCIETKINHNVGCMVSYINTKKSSVELYWGKTKSKRILKGWTKPLDHSRISQRSTVSHYTKSSRYIDGNKPTDAYPINTRVQTGQTRETRGFYNLMTHTQETLGGVSTLIFCILRTVKW